MQVFGEISGETQAQFGARQAGFELGPTTLEPGGLVLDEHGVRAYAVVRDGAELTLHVLSVSTSTTLAGPSVAITGRSLALTGPVTVGDAPAPGGTSLVVERTSRTPNGASVTTRLSDVQTGADGTFTVTDTAPTVPGPRRMWSPCKRATPPAAPRGRSTSRTGSRSADPGQSRSDTR